MGDVEFAVEVADNVGTQTVAAPGNPLREAAQTELSDIATNPQHPMHAGYHRYPIDPKVDAHLAELYGKLRGTTSPPAAPITASERERAPSATPGLPTEPVPPLSPEDARAIQALQQRDGPDYATNMADAHFGLTYVINALGGTDKADDLADAVLAAIDDLPPEVRAQVDQQIFLTDIARYYGKHARGYAR